MPSTPWPRAILHLDMDAFYVNVHILDHPEDAGIPLAIGGRPDGRGVVTSASYEARAQGVRSAMPMAHAVRECHNLKIAPPNWTRIKECSRQVMGVLTRFGPVEKMSVDEAYLDLSDDPDPAQKAADIRLAVREATGLPASVGLATSKLVAKVASDHEKPEGCTIVPPGTEAAFLAPLSVRAIWGIGPRTAERLAELGIETCEQLAASDAAQLVERFGRHGAALSRRARGIDERSVQVERGPPKSISSERTFNRDVADGERLITALAHMTAEVGTSLRKQQLQAHTVTVKFRWSDFTTITRQQTVGEGFDDDEAIYRLALALWRKHWPQGRPMRLLGVGVSKLAPPAPRRQLTLDL